MTGENIFVVSPHPDDAEIGIGGAIHRFVGEGHKVTILVVTGEGDLHMVHSNKVIAYEQRKEEQLKAAWVLGAAVEFLNFAPASKLDSLPLVGLLSRFDSIFPKGDRVYIPLPSYNRDHNVVWDACISALRPGKCDRIQAFAYEQAINCFGMQVFGQLIPRCYIEITKEDLDKRCLAILKHSSQVVGRTDTIAGVAGVMALAKLRGLEIGVEYAELVYPVRMFQKL